MSNLVFDTDQQSDQSVAKGNKGTYWINEMAWVYLRIVGTNKHGPFIKPLGAFNFLHEAMEEANEYDIKEGDDNEDNE